jgi:hypothetical protein
MDQPIKPEGIFERLWLWFRSDDAEHQYVCAATDLADVERRMRVLERASVGPPFVTFNH